MPGVESAFDELNLSDELFARFAKLLLARTGITIKDYKKYLVVNRLSKYVGTGKPYADFEDYYAALGRDRGGEMMIDFVNLLTTNYSYFFRDEIHFGVLADYLREHGPSQEYIRLWSAASSTGEEAYSMAITCARTGAPLTRDLKILATDISTKVLAEAERGRFAADKIDKHVDGNDIRSYFSFSKESKEYEVKPVIRDMVTFRHFNLHSAFPFKKLFDVVFLRNVLIYFANEEKEAVVNAIHDYIKPGGILMIGLSESLVGVKHPYQLLKNSIYRKPA